MADEEPSTPPIEAEAFEETDWLLVQIVDWADNGIWVPLTLNVAGTLISGTLIHAAHYFEQLRENYGASAAAFDEESGSAVKDIIGGMKEDYLKSLESHDAGKRRYIHLMDAKVFNAGNPIPANQGVFWRGKLSSVDGFWLGSLVKA